MWDELSLEAMLAMLAICLTIAAVGGALVGLGHRSRLRSVLIWTWACLPVFLSGLLLLVIGFDAISLLTIVLVLALPPWAALAVVGYSFVRRIREARAASRKPSVETLFS